MNMEADIHARNLYISPWQNRNADRRSPDTDKSPPSHKNAKSRRDMSNGHPRPYPASRSAPQRTGNNGRHADWAARKRQNRSWPPVEASFIALAIGTKFKEVYKYTAIYCLVSGSD
jgi:hypothetical protein